MTMKPSGHGAGLDLQKNHQMIRHRHFSGDLRFVTLIAVCVVHEPALLVQWVVSPVPKVSLFLGVPPLSTHPGDLQWRLTEQLQVYLLE